MASFASSLNQSTIDSLLFFGLVTTSLSPYPNEPMHTVVNYTLAPPGGGPINTTFLQQLGSETKRLAKIDVDPLFALTVLKSYLDEVNDPNEVAPDPWKVNSIWIAVAGAFIGLRLTVRQFLMKGIKRDDWAMAGSWFLMLSLGLFSFYYLDKGRPCIHIWQSSWSDYRWNLKGLYHNEIMYVVAIYTVKLAIMLFYWDLIPHDSSSHFRLFHHAFVATFVFVTAVSISTLLTIVFQCKPVYFWRDPMNAKCLPRLAVWNSLSWLLFASDIVVLALPIKIIWTVNIRKREKAIVICLFSLGGLIITTSHLIDDPDITFKQSFPGNWMFAEGALAMVTACLPTTKVLLLRCAPLVKSLSDIFSKCRKRCQNSDAASCPVEALKVSPRVPEMKDAAIGVKTTQLSTSWPANLVRSIKSENTSLTISTNDTDSVPESSSAEEGRQK